MTFVCRLDYYRDGSECVFTCFLKRLIFRNLKFVFYWKKLNYVIQFHRFVGGANFNCLENFDRIELEVIFIILCRLASRPHLFLPKEQRCSRTDARDEKWNQTFRHCCYTHNVLMWAQTRTTPRWADMRPILLFAWYFLINWRGKFTSASGRNLGKTKESQPLHANCISYLQRTAHNQRNGQRFLRILTWHVL